MPRALIAVAATLIAIYVAVALLSVERVRDPVALEVRLEDGDAARGRELFGAYGCGACHTVPSLRGARGTVGPWLGRFGVQSYIAGNLENRPDELVRWLTTPQQVEPGTAMPDLGVTPGDARDLAAFLYTLR